jgi:hypothetical protein
MRGKRCNSTPYECIHGVCQGMNYAVLRMIDATKHFHLDLILTLRPEYGVLQYSRQSALSRSNDIGGTGDSLART